MIHFFFSYLASSKYCRKRIVKNISNLMMCFLRLKEMQVEKSYRRFPQPSTLPIILLAEIKELFRCLATHILSISLSRNRRKKGLGKPFASLAQQNDSDESIVHMAMDPKIQIHFLLVIFQCF